MSHSLDRGPKASGARSIAAQTVTGIALTGDNPVVDARTISLAPGAIPEPADVTAPSGTHNLPRLPVRVFVGRDTALDQLTAALAENASAVVTQAIYGLGGVGKSELALQHADSQRTGYTLIWWVTAEDETQIQTALAALAARLCPVIAMAGTTADAAGWAMAWLQTHEGWLLILDNVNESGDVEPLIGQLTGGHVLVTTRRDTGWHQIAEPVRLDVLDPSPAVQLLTTRTGHHDDADYKVATSIADELGYLPLALDQAAAYITETHIGFATYLQRLRQHPAAMYASAGSGSAQQTIARLWDITIETIRTRQPAAVKLLHILAYYAPDSVPRPMLGGTDGMSKLVVDEALGLLASYSMTALTPETVTMHRLVQAVVLSSMPPPRGKGESFEDEDPLKTALEWLYNVIPADPQNNTAAWPLFRAILPHAESLAARFPLGSQPSSLARVQGELGLFQTSQGQYEQALRLNQSSLAIAEATFGHDAIDVAIALDNLATTYLDLGQPDLALPLQQRALPITEAARGRDHPDTAAALNNLAAAYSALGQADRALPLELRALRIKDKTLERDHPSKVFSLNNLAQSHLELGQVDRALPLLERALAISEAAYGADHPITASVLHNLALAYCILGRADRALPLAQRALPITEAALGPDHPNTAHILFALAQSYRVLGRAKQALPLLQRALAINEAVLGDHHPETAGMIANVALIYLDLGKPDLALPLAQRALPIIEAALGPNHPETAAALFTMSRIYSALGQPDRARPFMQRTEQIAMEGGRSYGLLASFVLPSRAKPSRRQFWRALFSP